MAGYGSLWLGMAGCRLEMNVTFHLIPNQGLYGPIHTKPHLASSEP
jgi:hypothetical protein